MPMEERMKKLAAAEIPYFGVCTNNTRVLEDPKKIYGYYQRTIIVENPVVNVTVGNNNWLKHGDMCNLDIKFTGTGPFDFCYVFHANDNSTEVAVKDEVCDKWETVESKEYLYRHFFPKASNSYTLVVFIKNQVSLVKTPIGVNFYEGKFSFSKTKFRKFKKCMSYLFSSSAFATFSRYCTSCVLFNGCCFDRVWCCLLRPKSKSISC